ncbi:DUF6481 family protein [Sphingomonas sp. G-3-2-10]|jgi:hypothetical protein|uniref:DUF6481 family protein n=1 Tax=Sphingomonas sp. G-3-2-10 TaxID=2728838 RepID=UPI00146DD385|nr:DUF6481 family protein [Sphingomonas sp. G-3-2-10]NML04165.1 hypothetical protein [Sphingomonas sp. G-3-2-10]
MTAYRAPDFNERAALSRTAKLKALAQLRAKPAPSEGQVADRKAVAIKRETAQAAQRARRAAEKQAASDARALAAETAARAAEAAMVPVKSDAERKAERDARYAARKARK